MAHNAKTSLKTQANPGFVTRIMDRLVPERIAARQLSRQNARLEAFLGAISEEYCGWSSTGLQAVTEGFIRLMGVDDIRSFEDLDAALKPDDAAALNGLFEHLKTTGQRFDITVQTQTNRTVRLYGAQGRAADNTELFNVLWALDMTEYVTSIEQAAGALQNAEKRENEFRCALDAAPYPAWIRNEELDITWVNRAYCKALGETAATIIAEQKELPVSESKKESGGAGRRRGGRGLAQRAVYDHSAQFERKHIVIGGARRLLEIHETPIQKNPLTLIGTAMDVTRMEDLETEMTRLTSASQDVLERLQTAIALYNSDTRLEFYNHAYADLWGLDESWLNTKPTLGEILERLREARMLPEQADFRQFKQKWQDRFTSLLEPVEDMMHLPDGKALRTVIMPHPMSGLMVTFEDVTSRLELETRFNTLIAVQRETIDSLSEGLAVFGQDGRLKLWNPAYAKIWGLNPEDLEGSPHISRLLEKTLPLFNQDTRSDIEQELLSAALGRDETQGQIERQDGIILKYTTAALPDGAVLNSFADVTDSVRVENALIEKNAALEEAERVKLDFLANVSYQLRTPLNAMMGFSEILGEQYFGPLNEKQLEYTQGMIDAGQRLVSLINDILDLSTIEAGYLDIQSKEFDVAKMIEDIKDLATDWAQKHDIQLKISCKKSTGRIFGDERRLKQVLINLISNAINFSEAKSTITVNIKRTDTHVIFEVKDTGVGIAEDDIERIFSPFERDRENRKSGAGLGLTLVKSIIELHGGTVSIQSALGRGTAVTCSIPVQPAP